MVTDSLVVERVGAIITLTINRSGAHNALDTDVLAALRGSIVCAADDPAIRAVVLTGAGEKAFSAGADLKELASMDVGVAQRTMGAGQQALRDIERAAIPVISAVNGIALGGGFELILASTFSLLSTRASLGLPESSLGLIPGFGGTQRLPRVVGSRVAAHLMLTGGRLDADRAYALGLTPLPPISPEELLPTATAIAETIAAQGPLAVRSILRALEEGRDAPLGAGLTLETGLATLALAGVESTEGIAAFFERRPAAFDDQVGAQ